MFDGPDWIGKTTQIHMASDALQARGYKVHNTRAHGGTPIGEMLRDVSLADVPRSAYTDLYLSRTIHVELSEDLRSKKQAGYICLVDRSPLSMWAYQVKAGGVSEGYAMPVIKEDIEMLDADVLIVYSAPLQLLKQRLLTRSDSRKDYFESKTDAYHEQVIAGYHETPRLFGAVSIDATGDVRDVHHRTMELILSYSHHL